MPTLSAIIITKNEEEQIAACLDSLSFVDEIIVLDTNSTDKTEEICAKYNAKFSTAPWQGFGKQKQLALEMASSDWVLSIDADEHVTEELKNEILALLQKPSSVVAYKIPRLTTFYGQAVTHCCNPKKDTPVRLIKRGSARFSDDLVHEKILVDGEIGTLQSQIIHHSFKNLEEILLKTNSYSTLGAEKLNQKGIQGSILKAFGHAIWVFLKIYFFKGGFMDGWPGFLIALGNFEGTFYRYAKLLEMQKYRH
ncbi:MAG: glycosyltransferase family 2 protein [Gammaproteobacteria bacterium]